MPTPIWITGAEIREVRHICAFFNGDDEDCREPPPFIEDGFECGDSVVQFVDLLTEARIVLSSAKGRRHFKLSKNVETYFRNSRYDQDRMLEAFGRMASGSIAGDFPLSFNVFRLDRASEVKTQIDHLIEFESRVDEGWHRHDDATTCFCNLSNFGGDAAIEIVPMHPMIILGCILPHNPILVAPVNYLLNCRQTRTSETLPRQNAP
jgi:hypothetical protein